MPEISTTSQLKALQLLENILSKNQGVELSVFRSGKIKKSGIKPELYGDNSFLSSYVSLSTAKIWEVFSTEGKFLPENAELAGIKINSNDLQNAKILIGPEELEKFSDQQKLIIDALVYDVMFGLTKWFKQENPDSQEDPREVMKKAFADLNFNLIDKNPKQFLLSLYGKMKRLGGKPLGVEADDTKAYEEILKEINKSEKVTKQEVEEKRKEGLHTLEKSIEEVSAFVRSEEFLGKTGPVDQEVLIDKAKTLHSYFIEPAFKTEHKKIQPLYGALVTESLYQALEGGKQSVAKVIEKVGLNAKVGSPTRAAAYYILDHFNGLSEAAFTLVLSKKEALTPLNNAMRLSKELATQLPDLKDRFNEKSSKLFLATVKADIEEKTLNGGWDTLFSQYKIQIDNKSYTVPKRIFEQYNLIQNFQAAGEEDKNAADIAKKVYETGVKTSSGIFGASKSTTEYFSNFKDKYKEMVTSPEPSEPKNKHGL